MYCGNALSKPILMGMIEIIKIKIKKILQTKIVCWRKLKQRLNSLLEKTPTRADATRADAIACWRKLQQGLDGPILVGENSNKG